MRECEYPVIPAQPGWYLIGICEDHGDEPDAYELRRLPILGWRVLDPGRPACGQYVLFHGADRIIEDRDLTWYMLAPDGRIFDADTGDMEHETLSDCVTNHARAAREAGTR